MLASDLLRLKLAKLKTSKKDVIEIAGIFAVVASLILVGMQLHLDRKVALADQYYDKTIHLIFPESAVRPSRGAVQALPR